MMPMNKNGSHFVKGKLSMKSNEINSVEIEVFCIYDVSQCSLSEYVV